MSPLKLHFSLIIGGILAVILIIGMRAAAVGPALTESAHTGSESLQDTTSIQVTARHPQSALPSGQRSETAESTIITQPIQVPTPAPEIPHSAPPAPASAITDAVYQPAPLHSKVSIPVLNYHSVTIQPGNRAAITPKKLEEQMQYLAEQGYTTLSVKEFIDIWEGRISPPTKPVLLTFDDGYKDNYTAAMPILKKYDFRATLFMSPGMVEDGYFLNWDEVKEMHQAGWDIEPHGMTHPHLPRLSAEKQKYEITEARRQIEEQLGITADVFCYPYGERNQVTLNILKENEFRYAFTIDQGKASPDQNPLLIRRLFVNGEEGLSSFKALLK